MNRRQALKASIAAATGASIASVALAGDEEQSEASLQTVMGLMGAMGSGDMAAMADLMADDMVWHNEGDSTLPWIGENTGKEAIFEFLNVREIDLIRTLG